MKNGVKREKYRVIQIAACTAVRKFEGIPMSSCVCTKWMHLLDIEYEGEFYWFPPPENVLRVAEALAGPHGWAIYKMLLARNE